jgi:hypothetical protein
MSCKELGGDDTEAEAAKQFRYRDEQTECIVRGDAQMSSATGLGRVNQSRKGLGCPDLKATNQAGDKIK